MIARIRRFAVAVLAATVAVFYAPPVRAQQADAQGSAGAPTAGDRLVPAGPTIDRAAVGARPRSDQKVTTEEAEAALQQRLGLGRARALMIVGFGALIVGLLIGEDIGTLIAVVGAAVGLYGLYHYLK